MNRDDILTFNRNQLAKMVDLGKPYTAEELERYVKLLHNNDAPDYVCDLFERKLADAKAGVVHWNVLRMVFCRGFLRPWFCERQMGSFTDVQKARAYADELNNGYRTTEAYIVTDLVW